MFVSSVWKMSYLFYPRGLLMPKQTQIGNSINLKIESKANDDKEALIIAWNSNIGGHKSI